MQIKPLWFWLILGMWFAAAQGQDTFTLRADQLQNGKSVELDKLGWKYAPGDEPRFADPQFDDRAWETIPNTAFDLDHLPKNGWQGIGWFRLRVQIAPEAANDQLALLMRHWGASEIYLDGKLVHRFGAIGTSAENQQAYNPNGILVGISFGVSGEHLIAVRHSMVAYQNPSSAQAQWLAKQERNLDTGLLLGAGFKMSLASSDSFRKHNSVVILDVVNRLFRAGLVSAVALLFLLLFYFYPRQTSTVYFGIFSLCLVLNIFTLFFKSASHFDLTATVSVNLIEQLLWLSSNLFLLVFLYSAFSVRLPRYFWIVVGAGLASLIFYIFLPHWYVGFLLSGLTLGFVGIEALRITASKTRQKKDGAWINLIGALLYSPLMFYWSLNDLGIATLPEVFLFVIRQVSVISIVIAISIYLARQVAQTNKNLEAKLVEVESLTQREIQHEKEKARMLIVEAENDRRAAELEEARQLQLSMLPKKLPSLPHLDIAAYMKTASEVGGDYYDFHTSEDGTLTIAVGDATGHGLKAGTMVASVKSLFMTLAYHPDITHIFSRLNQTLKQMQLRGLFMAMTIAKIKENHLTLSIAGMPPVWIYRAANQQIEEIMLKQLPLGGIAKYTYQQCECSLHSGDVIVLMSDGLPERFNEKNEMLEDESAKIFIADNPHLSAQEIINGLVKLGDDWGGARPQDDDVTFVVLKMNSEPKKVNSSCEEVS